MSLIHYYIFVFVDIFNMIYVYSLIHLFILYNILLGCTSSLEVFLYISCAQVVPPLCRHYTSFCIDVFLHIIYMSAVICFHTLYNILICCNPYGVVCHIYLLDIATVSPYSLTCIYDSWLITLCLNLLMSWYMHWNTYLCS